ncbi:MAG TPA: sigma-54 dependent transcriptional regulator [Spirochaetota bacterium]|nr:sigma-54 dependent transcriptional regulator [Spirochaetota bacterium]HOL57321.1 sigma-54 dependent transcriptional regulator [Spirochaetota bacterium]HPP04894.1 sigma-54 dependent transcriptional regulator [Spirochaetota bacterium]
MNILIIDDEDNIREIISDILIDEKHNVFKAEDGIKGLDIISKEKIDICFLDVWMPNMGGIDVLKKIKENYPEIEVVMISGHAKIDLAVNATKLGAYDFLEKPLTMEKIIGLVKTIENSKKESRYNRNLEQEKMIGNSPQMQAIRELIENASMSDARILILGENGTGKELVAREIHNKSFRKNNPFVCVNCAAIPENLIEAELFGYVKGAFTGAISDRIGKFELANSGTLFLDEIADMSLATQAKVLRVLQEMKITKLGDTKVKDIDVRIIAATNKDIKEEIKKGNFREDLFYRLNVIPFYIPPLRERKEDIPLLVDYYTEKISRESNIEKKIWAKDALEYLKQYPWPGNIRQLRNIVERIMVIVDKKEIDLSEVKKHLDSETILLKNNENSKYDDYKLNTAIDEFEKDFIEKKLKENDYNITKTAKALGIYPSNLYFKIHKLGINIKDKEK